MNSRFHRFVTVPATILAAAAAAVALIALLQARSDASRRAETRLGEVGAALNERTVVPMAVVFGAPTPLVALQMVQLKQSAESMYARLRAEDPVPGLDDVEVALNESLASSD